MRILHVVNVLAVGGAETMVLQLAREQRRMGNEVTICAMYGEGPLDSRAREFGIPVVHLHSKESRTGKIIALHRYLKANQYDILHSHWEVWLATALAGFLLGIPRVHTNHSNHSRRLFLEHRLACLFTVKLAVLTPDVEPYISRWVGVPKRKIAVIPNGIDLAVFDNVPPASIEGVPQGAPVVGMLARLCPPKDYSTFIQAARIVADARPEVHFLCIGEGRLKSHYEQQADQAGLKTMHFLGRRLDVPSLLSRMTINVLSSLHEGLGMVLLEAMASGCPSIGTDIPAVRYTLNNGKAGVLVPKGDAAALADAIVLLLDDVRKREELIASGQEHVKSFSVQRMAESYLDLYRELCQHGARRI